MEVIFEPGIKDQITKIKVKQPRVFLKIQKQLLLFSQNPTHPSLRTHKLKGKLSNAWSLSVEGDFRILYRYSKNSIRIFKVGNHSEVYK